MKKGLWLIFKCQNCGKKYQEKYTGDEPWVKKDDIPEHIGKYTHIVSTHKCSDTVRGCATLIGIQDWGKHGK